MISTPTTSTTQSAAGGNAAPLAPQGQAAPGNEGTQIPLGEETPAGESSPEETAPSGPQAVQQEAAAGEGNELPFTGFAAIPVMLAGIALLVTGAVLRRRSRPEAS